MENVVVWPKFLSRFRKRAAVPADPAAPVHEAPAGQPILPDGRPIRRDEPLIRQDERLVHRDEPLSLCVAGGKGGTGKTTVSSALAVSLSRHGSVLLIDGDLGAGNAHLLQDVVPSHSLVDVAAGRVGAAEARVACAAGLDLLAGGSGYSHAAQLRPEELARLAFEVGQIEEAYDYVVVDGAAGLSPQTLSLAAAAQRIWLVSTPDVTALTDAYAFLKVFLAAAPDRRPELVLNRCRGAREGQEALRRLQDTARRFLGFELPCLSLLPEDDAARRSLKRREAVTVERDGSELAQGIEGLAGQLAAGAVTGRGGWGRRLLDGLVS